MKSLKHHPGLYRLFCLFVAISLTISHIFISPVSAIIDSELFFYNSNGIYYYNPNGNDCLPSYNGDINVYGNTIPEKLWTGLTSFLTDEQAAGIMGNMEHESSLNPLRHEDSQVSAYQPGFDVTTNSDVAYGIGLVQWSFERRISFLQFIQSKDASLIQYFQDYQTYGSASLDTIVQKLDDDTLNTIIALELEYIKDELDASYSDFYQTTTVADAANYFLTKYERPANPDQPQRAIDAQKYYDQFHGKTISGNTTPSASSSSNSTGSSASATNKGTLLSNHSTVTFYSSVAEENAGYTGKNAGTINGGNLAAGQVAIDTGDPDLALGDVIYIETTSNQSAEGSFANGKYFIVADTGAGNGNISGNHNIDIFHDPASENDAAPFGKGTNAKIYKVASNVSWEDYLSKYSNGNASTDTTGASVTVIGDAVAKASQSTLKELLPDVEVNNSENRLWGAALGILESSTIRSQLVFAIGSKDTAPTLTETDIEKLASVAKEHNIFIVTSFTTGANQSAYEVNNKLFKTAAEKYDNIRVIDWAGSISDSPEKYLESDGFTPNEEGQRLWAELVANAVKGTANIDICGVTASGDVAAIQQLVLKYAWPEYHSGPYVTMKPEYEQLVRTRQSSGKYVGGISYPGVDCGGWVTALLQESGYEPNYNEENGNTDTQEAWVKSHGWTLVNSSPTTEVDTGKLRAGDVAFSSGHTFIYVGEIPGFGSNIASASLDDRAPMAGAESLTFGNGVVVRWYRKGV